MTYTFAKGDNHSDIYICQGGPFWYTHLSRGESIPHKHLSRGKSFWHIHLSRGTIILTHTFVKGNNHSDTYICQGGQSFQYIHLSRGTIILKQTFIKGVRDKWKQIILTVTQTFVKGDDYHSHTNICQGGQSFWQIHLPRGTIILTQTFVKGDNHSHTNICQGSQSFLTKKLNTVIHKVDN
jgi:hypothetical protein